MNDNQAMPLRAHCSLHAKDVVTSMEIINPFTDLLSLIVTF